MKTKRNWNMCNNGILEYISVYKNRIIFYTVNTSNGGNSVILVNDNLMKISIKVCPLKYDFLIPFLKI